MKNLFYYDINNFGDALSKVLFEMVVDMPITVCDVNCLDDYYLFLGSLIHPKFVKKNSIICGCGFISDTIILKEDPKKIISVRGKYSKNKFKKNKINLIGDPALFTSELIKLSVNKKHKIGIIPHYVDYKEVKHSIINEDVLIINPETKDVYSVISDILSCELIISSSLHGVIVAHSYNIPALWCEFSGKVIGDGFKFFDYFSSIGVENYRIKLIGEEIKKLNNIKFIDSLFDRFNKQKQINSFNIENYYLNLKNEINEHI
jgi:pyruvyltransferase